MKLSAHSDSCLPLADVIRMSTEWGIYTRIN